MIKKLIVGLIAAAVLVAGGVTVGTVIANKPEMVVKSALTNAVEDLAERDELATLIDMVKQGSLAVEGDYEDIAFEGKLYFEDLLTSGKEQIYLEDLMVKVGADKVNLSAYYASDYAYITDCNLLDGTWGIIRGDAEQDFLNSIFAFGAEGDYAVSEEEHEAIVNALKLYDSETGLAFEKDAQKLVKKYSKKLEKIIVEHAVFEEETDKVPVGGDRMECRIITVSVDEEALAAMLRDAFDILKEADDIRELVMEYGEHYLSLGDDDIDIEKYYDEELLNEEEFEGFIENILATEFELSLQVMTPKSSTTLRKLVIHMTAEDYDADVLTLDLGKNGIKKADYITVEIEDNTFAYEIAEDNSKLYEAYFHYNKEEIGHLEIDKKEDTYTLTLDGITVSGDFIEDGDKTTISLDKIKTADETASYDIQITLDPKDAMPQPEKSDDISSVFEITQEELAELFETVGQLLG